MMFLWLKITGPNASSLDLLGVRLSTFLHEGGREQFYFYDPLEGTETKT